VRAEAIGEIRSQKIKKGFLEFLLNREKGKRRARGKRKKP